MLFSSNIKDRRFFQTRKIIEMFYKLRLLKKIAFTFQNVVITATVQVVIKLVVCALMIFHVNMSMVVVLEDVLLGLSERTAKQVRYFYTYTNKENPD